VRLKRPFATTIHQQLFGPAVEVAPDSSVWNVCVCVCLGDVDGVGGEFLAPALETFSMPAVELERAHS